MLNMTALTANPLHHAPSNAPSMRMFTSPAAAQLGFIHNVCPIEMKPNAFLTSSPRSAVTNQPTARQQSSGWGWPPIANAVSDTVYQELSVQEPYWNSHNDESPWITAALMPAAGFAGNLIGRNPKISLVSAASLLALLGYTTLGKWQFANSDTNAMPMPGTAGARAASYLQNQRDRNGVALWDKLVDAYQHHNDLDTPGEARNLLTDRDLDELEAIKSSSESPSTPDEYHGPRTGRNSDQPFSLPMERQAGQSAEINQWEDDTRDSLVAWVLNLIRAAAADPCVSFHDYANADLLFSQSVPANGMAITRRELRLAEQLEGRNPLIEQAKTWRDASPAAQVVDALYQSGMSDEKARQGEASWQQRQRVINRLSGHDDIWAYFIDGIRHGHAIGLDWTRSLNDNGFTVDSPEITNPRDLANIASFREKAIDTLKRSGLAHSDAERQADGIINIEQGLAGGTRPHVGFIPNRPLAIFATAAKAENTLKFPFTQLTDALGINQTEELKLHHPINRFTKLGRLLHEAAIEDWQAWFRYKEFLRVEPYLLRGLEPTSSEYRSEYVRSLIDPSREDIQSGKKQPVASWAIDELFLEHRVPPEAHALVGEVERDTLAAVRQLIDDSSLSTSGRQIIYNKLDAVRLSVAARSGLHYNTTEFSAEASFLSNVETAQAKLRAFDLQWARSPRHERANTEASSGQHRYIPETYNADINEITIPLLNLQSIVGDLQTTDRATWYGSLGFAIGHELGRLILAVRNELPADDKSRFEESLKCLWKTDDRTKHHPALQKLVSENNYADLMGLQLAYNAMHKGTNPMPAEKQNDERFFLAYGRLFGAVTTTDYERRHVAKDTIRADSARFHSAFAGAFNCPTPLQLAIKPLEVICSQDSKSTHSPTPQETRTRIVRVK